MEKRLRADARFMLALLAVAMLTAAPALANPCAALELALVEEMTAHNNAIESHNATLETVVALRKQNAKLTAEIARLKSLVTKLQNEESKNAEIAHRN